MTIVSRNDRAHGRPGIAPTEWDERTLVRPENTEIQRPMKRIDALQEKRTEEQTTETDKTAVCDGGHVETDTDTDDGDTGGDGDDEAGDGEDDDGDDDSDDDGSGCRRQATVNRAGDGQPLGAAVWLNADELAALGVDIDAADAVAYRVEDGDRNHD